MMMVRSSSSTKEYLGPSARLLWTAAVAAAAFLDFVSATPEDQNLACEHCSHCYHEFEFDVPWLNNGQGGVAEFKDLDVSYHNELQPNVPSFTVNAPDLCDACLGNIHRAIKFAIKDIEEAPDQLWISNPGGIASGIGMNWRYGYTDETVMALNSNTTGYVHPCDVKADSQMCLNPDGADPAYWAYWIHYDSPTVPRPHSFKVFLTGCDYWPEKEELTKTWVLARYGTNYIEFQLGASSNDDCKNSHVSPDCVPPPPEPTATYTSVAQRFIALCLNAIRREIPDPGVHARNLFHLSAAMWDAWVAYDDTNVSTGFLFAGTRQELDVAARQEAIAFAAYRILEHRYAANDETLVEISNAMADLGYNVNVLEGETAAAIGNSVAGAIITYGNSDGSNEDAGYADSTNYQAVNDPLYLNTSGTAMNDASRWQPLAFADFVTQNGIEIGAFTQVIQGPHWGSVTPFALVEGEDKDNLGSPPSLPVWLNPGTPPQVGSSTAAQNILEVIELNSYLHVWDTATINISPCCMHNNALGTNNGTGYEMNPSTGSPYEDVYVNRADYGRVVAEYWADGPDSETPPGHWNVIAQDLTRHPDFEPKWLGKGNILDALEWDVKSSFILNGALHDAAVAAWSNKRYHDYSRPISQIRYMGGLGQSSDNTKASYHVSGLPLQPDLIEEITHATVLTHHAHLSEHMGKIAVLNWRPPSGNGVKWVLAEDWMPYQRSTFVTPAFPGFVSGHSTFSRAAAEVLANITGSEYFPGGLYEQTIKAGDLAFDYGPLTDVTLSHATYFDAADEAGRSRLWGGIHPTADDTPGRQMGSTVGGRALEAMSSYFERAPSVTPQPTPAVFTPAPISNPTTPAPTTMPTGNPTPPATPSPTLPPGCITPNGCNCCGFNNRRLCRRGCEESCAWSKKSCGALV